MITKILLSAAVAAMTTAAQLPSTSYGTPHRGQPGGSFGDASTGGHGGAQAGGGFGGSGGHAGGFGGGVAGFGGGAAGHGGAGTGGFVGVTRGASEGTYRPSSGPVIPILVDERDGPHADGTYSFNFETGDGISRNEQGYPRGPEGAVVSQGGWSFTFPDGTPAVFSFVADENGYRVESDLVPTPHPLPAHAIAQIEFARQQEAQRGSYGGQQGTSPSDFGGASSGGFSGAPGGFSGVSEGARGSYSTGGGSAQRGSFGGVQTGGSVGTPSAGFGASQGGFGASQGGFGVPSGAPSGGFGDPGTRSAPRPAPAATPSRTYGFP